MNTLTKAKLEAIITYDKNNNFDHEALKASGEKEINDFYDTLQVSLVSSEAEKLESLVGNANELETKNTTIAQYKELITKAVVRYDKINGNGDYHYVGVRYEDKLRQVGEECDYSKHNAGDREFPEHGTAEYDELDDLYGTSAWSAHKYLSNYDLSGDQSQLVSDKFNHVAHAYIVVGQYANTPSDADDGEIVIEDAVVAEVLF